MSSSTAGHKAFLSNPCPVGRKYVCVTQIMRLNIPVSCFLVKEKSLLNSLRTGWRKPYFLSGRGGRSGANQREFDTLFFLFSHNLPFRALLLYVCSSIQICRALPQIIIQHPEQSSKTRPRNPMPPLPTPILPHCSYIRFYSHATCTW